MIPFRALSVYKQPRNGQMPVSPHKVSAPLFEEIAAETNRYVSKKTCTT
jgi:hypothetical protein